NITKIFLRPPSNSLSTSDNCNKEVENFNKSEINNSEEPTIVITILQPEDCQIQSINLLSDAKHTELYHREYICTSQGSRLTDLDSDPIYETNLELNQPYDEVTLK
ncbi:unnamed protein product, partial [Didymodactylos carnosus]